ncbi:hypothetical protein SISNIDRAFT_482212 [Sistotremastrum niveocremeum HHB9708]|uniref:Mitochondrial splicing suppressor 51-like C-terminal domain-containing protein n=1 Tax=Sistotremastrum niveocremeum HHB9708 TaxID=1314777 RepID=A0A164YVV2_9AGAM|nr:hypothetical protein SISNIDRAFT_482212 [Sistotremastrum niveocremeum HHB9708]
MAFRGPQVQFGCNCAGEAHIMRIEIGKMARDPSYKTKSKTHNCLIQFMMSLIGSPLRRLRRGDILQRGMLEGGMEGLPECRWSNYGWAQENNQMLKFPDYAELATQFPWTIKIGKGYYADFALASKGLYGCGPSFGWWTEPSCVARDTRILYLHRETPYTEKQGWKLPDEEMPWLEFDPSKDKVPPQRIADFEDSWTSYYKWRGLPMSSPAAFRLHWPLTIYRILRELGIKPGTVDNRKTIKIHLVGPENRKELAILPVFGELALLFPYSDLRMTLISEETFLTVSTARRRSLARQPFAYKYTAPESIGRGSIHITLDSQNRVYAPFGYGEIPDVIIGLHAGLTNPEWIPVIHGSIRLDIPFAVTEYVETCMSVNDDALIKTVLPEGLRALTEHAPTETEAIARFEQAMLIPERKRIFNTFMCPGLHWPQRSLLPYAHNSWIYIVHTKTST